MLKKSFHLIYTLYFVFIVIFWFLFLSPFCYPIFFTLGKRKNAYYSSIAKIWANLILFSTGLQPKRIGKFPKDSKSYIYLLNHQSQLDIIIALAVLPKNFLFVAKQELFNIPILGHTMRNCGYIAINRENTKAANATLNRIKDLIAEGKSVLIFPEGTRTIDGSISKVKRGSIMLAFQTHTPMIPVIINPAYKILPKGTFLFRPQRIKITIGEPMIFNWENLKRDYTIQTAADIEAKFVAMLQTIS